MIKNNGNVNNKISMTMIASKKFGNKLNIKYGMGEKEKNEENEKDPPERKRTKQANRKMQ